jgi:Fe2+ transport system protein FeoA
MMPLAMVERGRKVRLVSVNGGHDLMGRLISMGLVPGVELEVVLNSSRGPFVVSAGGSRIMLGRGVAHKLLVA